SRTSLASGEIGCRPVFGRCRGRPQKRALRAPLARGCSTIVGTISQGGAKIKVLRHCAKTRPREQVARLSRGIGSGASGVVCQSPSPGASEKYFSNLFSTPSNSAASGGGSRFSVMLGQIAEYLVLISNQWSSPVSVSGLIASAGHSG